MKTAEELQRQIKTASELHDVVKTMKSLSAVNMGHYEKAIKSINAYYRTVLLGLQAMVQQPELTFKAPKRSAAQGKTGIILFGSDQGMCGGFNDRIIEFMIPHSKDLQSAEGKTPIICVGMRCAALLKAKGLIPQFLYPVPGSLDTIVGSVQDILADIDSWLESGAATKILLFHNCPTFRLSYSQKRTTLLPLSRKWYNEISSRSWPSPNTPIFTMEASRLFSALTRQYLFVSLYRAFAESMATENSARLSAMQSAEKNIEERLENLTSRHRRQRQTAITSELLDIVSGFEAQHDKQH